MVSLETEIVDWHPYVRYDSDGKRYMPDDAPQDVREAYAEYMRLRMGIGITVE